jgi:hypothetical protein
MGKHNITNIKAKQELLLTGKISRCVIFAVYRLDLNSSSFIFAMSEI